MNKILYLDRGGHSNTNSPKTNINITMIIEINGFNNIIVQTHIPTPIQKYFQQ